MNNTQPFIDTTIKTDAHYKSLKYVQKILEKYDTTIDTLTDEKLTEIIKNYRTKTNQPLAYGSVNCLLSTIKKEKPTIKLTTYKLELMSKINYLYKISSKNEEIIKTIIIKYVKMLYTYPINEEYYKKYAVLLDTSLSVVLTLCTNLRSSELKQLTYSYVRNILNRQSVPIRIKKKLKPTFILANIDMLQGFNEKIVEFAKLHGGDKAILIQSTISSTNKHFRKSCYNLAVKKQIIQDGEEFIHLGVQAIRKINTTALIESGSLKLAQLFNRHRNSQTTDLYYNTGNYMSGKMNTLYKQILSTT